MTGFEPISAEPKSAMLPVATHPVCTPSKSLGQKDLNLRSPNQNRPPYRLAIPNNLPEKVEKGFEPSSLKIKDLDFKSSAFNHSATRILNANKQILTTK